MGMYSAPEPLASARDLENGDIVAGVIQVGMPTSRNVALLKGPKVDLKVPPAAITGPLSIELRAFGKLERVPFALVLSNSCDIAQGDRVEFAPVVPFAFRSDGNALSDAARWGQISAAATGQARPKRFYLPEHKGISLPRSEAMLAESFLLTQDLLGRWMQEAGAVRVATLSPEARRHLQWAYAAMQTRNPREDEDWPSDEDRRLKLAYLVDVIPRTPREERAALELERDRLAGELGVTLPLPDPYDLMDAAGI
jgi:hypothetical protein